MKTTLVVLLLVSALAAVTPIASAGPDVPTAYEVCGKAMGEEKCEQTIDDIRDMLLCTCPPL